MSTAPESRRVHSQRSGPSGKGRGGVNGSGPPTSPREEIAGAGQRRRTLPKGSRSIFAGRPQVLALGSVSICFRSRIPGQTSYGTVAHRDYTRLRGLEDQAPNVQKFTLNKRPVLRRGVLTSPLLLLSITAWRSA